MTTRPDTTRESHRRAVRFFGGLLVEATAISLLGNIAYAVLPSIPRVVIQIGAAAVPPIVLLAAVHGIGLAVRAGASGRVYHCAVGAVALIGVGAFALSFLALRDLMLAIGCGVETAWVFPVIIDTAVAVSTMMLVALGDKPVRRTRTVSAPTSAQVKTGARTAPAPARPHSVRADRVASSAESAPRRSALRASSVQIAPVGVEADYPVLAQALVDAGATTKATAVVASILSAHAAGTRPNRIAADLGVHHKTVARIIDAAEDLQRRQLVAV